MTTRGWQSLSGHGKPAVIEHGLQLENGKARVSVTALSSHVIRVRFAPRPSFGAERSYAIVDRDLGPVELDVDIAPERSSLITSALRVKIDHDPLRIAFEDGAGESLDTDDPLRGMAWVGSAVKVWKRLRPDEHVYGLGEKNGRLDRRGRRLGGSSLTMWNTDTGVYDPATDPLYVSVPFFLVVRAGRAHGIFLDNTHRSHFDVGHEDAELLSFGAAGGELDYYFIDGPDPKDVLARFTMLTGRMPLPPRWALGYHQCRYSYYPESRVRFIAANLRERRIPADALWLDIHHLDAMKPFTWDPARFPDPARLIADLRTLGLRTVVIVDPHPKKEPGYAPYDSGLAGDHFVKSPDGMVFEGPVWPARAEHDRGPSVFPDFSSPAARVWWGGLHAPLVEQGVAGIWNDMNEPAVFDTPAATLPLDVRHAGDGHPTDHREIHNVYGMLMTRATREGLLRLRHAARPFVLTRATFAGGQRFAAVWTGDNRSSWADLRASLPMLLGMGLSGLAFVGTDVGGFGGVPSAELFTRWLQTGVFYPFLRVHTEDGTPEQEPWSYGSRHEAINRRAIELRYELLPHLYDLIYEAATTGLPVLRPLVLEHPEDPRCARLEDQFLWGRDLLVAPVLEEGSTSRRLYLPAGEWLDFWTGECLTGGRPIERAVSLESIPIFVRAGAFVFRQPVVQHTGEMTGQPLRIDVYPGPSPVRSFYEDAGEGFDHLEGGFCERDFRVEQQAQRLVVTIGAPRGGWRPEPRRLELRVRMDAAPRGVAVDGTALEPLAWSWRAGFVMLSLEDLWHERQIVLELAG